MTFWSVALLFILAGIIVVRSPTTSRAELGETGPTETQPIWQARIERASKFAGPLLGAYVTVEIAQRLVEQWLGYASPPFPCLLCQ